MKTDRSETPQALRALCQLAGQQAVQQQRAAINTPRTTRRWWALGVIGSVGLAAAVAVAAQWPEPHEPARHAQPGPAFSLTTPTAMPAATAWPAAADTPMQAADAGDTVPVGNAQPAAPASPRAPAEIDPNAAEERLSQPDGSC